MSPLQLIIQIIKRDFNFRFPDRQQAGPEDQGEEASSGSRDFMLKDGYVKRDEKGNGGSRWEDGEVNIGECRRRQSRKGCLWERPFVDPCKTRAARNR